MMNHNLKALGVALVAALATGAMVASAASATDFFTTSNGKAWVTGVSHEQQIRITPNVLFECTTSKVTGTIENGSSSMTVLKSYTGKLNQTPHGTPCESPFGGMTFDMNGCHDILTGNTDGEDESQTDATVWIQCPQGKEIVITTEGGCTIKIPSQTPTGGGVTYQNLSNHVGGSAVKITTTVTGVTFKANGFVCLFGGVEEVGDNMDFISTVIVTGYEDLGGTMASPIEGARVPIEIS